MATYKNVLRYLGSEFDADVETRTYRSARPVKPYELRRAEALAARQFSNCAASSSVLDDSGHAVVMVSLH